MTARADIDSDSILEAALDYARRGLPVFPCYHILPMLPPYDDKYMCSCGKLTCKDQGKHPYGPLVPNGFRDASADPERARHWWSCRPGANIGVDARDKIVIDVDPRHGGFDSMKMLVSRHGPLPATWRAITGGGGCHIYYKGNTTCRTGQWPGVDIKSDGGYVVVPPSNHISGRTYRWQEGLSPADVPLADAPGWLIDNLKPAPGRAGRDSKHWRGLAESTTNGQRNVTVTSLAGKLLRCYVDPILVGDLLHAWNQTYSQPPLEPAEVDKIFRSILEREVRREEGRRGK